MEATKQSGGADPQPHPGWTIFENGEEKTFTTDKELLDHFPEGHELKDLISDAVRFVREQPSGSPSAGSTSEPGDGQDG